MTECLKQSTIIMLEEFMFMLILASNFQDAFETNFSRSSISKWSFVGEYYKIEQQWSHIKTVTTCILQRKGIFGSAYCLSVMLIVYKY